MRKILRKIAAWFRRQCAPVVGAGEYVKINVQDPRVLTLTATGVCYEGHEEEALHRAAVELAELALRSMLIHYEFEKDLNTGWYRLNAYLKAVENT